MTGALNVGGLINATGIGAGASGITSTGNLVVNGTVTAGNVNVTSITATGALGAGPAGITSAGDIGASGNIGAGGKITAGGSGFYGPYISLTGDGYKPGGGPWTDSSDARIKTVVGDYSRGLPAIKQLLPVRYSFKGNDAKHAADGKEHIGLVAQTVETVMPEMVTTTTGSIDGKPVTDLRMLDSNALVFALVNCVQELSQRIEALEAQRVGR
jgi:hypothetical protein